MKYKTCRSSTVLKGHAEGAGYQLRAAFARYAVANNTPGEQVNDDTEVDRMIFDFKICNIADPNLVWFLGFKFSFD